MRFLLQLAAAAAVITGTLGGVAEERKTYRHGVTPSRAFSGCNSSNHGSSPTVTGHCPTVTATQELCTTCYPLMSDCVAEVTVSNPCHCPSIIPTETDIFPCSDSVCPTERCQSTRWIYPPETRECPTVIPTDEPSGVTCTPTVTVSAFPTSGCQYNCTTGWNACIMDKFVILPCGCDTAASVVTSTSTIGCATATPCEMCNTGFPWTIPATGCATPTYV